jgi:hypothetical protein
VNALNNPEVGKYLNENCVSSFQKVATFKIVGNQKQGGNVAAYFCAPDGRVLHVVAGPVNAATMLAEAKWVVSTTEKAIKDSKGDGAEFKAMMRKAHAEKLRTDSGLVVEPVTYDPPVEQDPNSALTYNDPSGRPLAPKLPPPPIDGPDVSLKDKQDALAKAPEARAVLDRKGRGWQLDNQGRVHQILAAHAMVKIENVYGTIFENILGEKISTKPVEVVTPFPWVKEREKKGG